MPETTPTLEQETNDSQENNLIELDQVNEISEGSMSITDIENLRDSQIQNRSRYIQKPYITPREVIVSYSVRHNLTDFAISDVLKMLQVLGISNASKNISEIFSLKIRSLSHIIFVLVENPGLIIGQFS